jgi:DNA replication initiation complex subunit (GINS family)
MEELNYKKLRDLLYEEKSSGALVALPEDFYSRLEDFMSRKRLELDKSHSLIEIREFENIVKTVREVHAQREQKILFRALRSEGRHDTTGLTREEHELFDSISHELGESRGRFEGMMDLSKPAKKAPQPEEEASETFKKVRILKDVPAYRGADEATYGPFKLGQEQALPMEEADWLVKSRLAESL